MTETEGRETFYHGTQMAIHKLAEPFLDPKFARHCDEGDPQTPHVFVTRDRKSAEMFALKVREAITITTFQGEGRMVYSRIPKGLHGGWLYTCSENPERPFRQISIRGQPSDKWVSPEKVLVTMPVFIPGLEYIARRGVEVYVLSCGVTSEMWSDITRNATSEQLESIDLCRQQAKLGNLRRVNIG